MGDLSQEVWALITARGGSKSMPLKNLAPLAGRPLMGYCIAAAKQCPSLNQLWCSTDSQRIAAFCDERGVEVQNRPPELAGDNASSLDVIIYFLETVARKLGRPPGYVLLLEPTSPFIQPGQIEKAIGMIKADPTADSVQTVTQPPPNHHAFNQRDLHRNGTLSFRYAAERAGLVNKQSKPQLYVHGNLRVMRSSSLLANRDIFGPRSLALVIDRVHAFDADGPEDFKWAEALIAAGLVQPA